MKDKFLSNWQSNKYFFIHVPKTGGSSLFEVFSQAYGPGNCRQHIESLIIPEPSPEILSELLEYRFLSAHVPYDYYACFASGGFLPLTVIREPINQFFSHANHILTEDVGDGILSDIQGKLKISVGHFLDHATQDELKFFDSPQSKTIFSGTIDWRAISLADRVEWLGQQYVAIFTTETMESEIAFILKTGGALFPRKNVKNYKRQPLTDRQLDTLSDLVQEDRLLHDSLIKGRTSLGYNS